MNLPNNHKAHPKKHAGHPSTASVPSPTALAIALIRSSAIGSGCALGIALLFLLFAASAIQRLTDPIALIYPFSLAILYVVALSCGMLTIRIHGQSPWICGTLSGIMLLLLCLLIGAFLPAGNITQVHYALWVRLPVIPLALLGAHLAKKRPVKPRRKRRK